jgi:hypothetical protein
MRFPQLMTRTDASACRAIIPDPSRPGPPHHTDPRELHDADAPHLLAYLAAVPDPRATRGRRHRLVAILALAAAAVLAGTRSIAAIAEWAADAPQPVRVALGARRDAPDHWAVPAEATTIRRTLGRLDAHALAAAVGAWLAARDHHDRAAPDYRQRPRQLVVAVDGKTLRGAHPTSGRRHARGGQRLSAAAGRARPPRRGRHGGRAPHPR